MQRAAYFQPTFLKSDSSELFGQRGGACTSIHRSGSRDQHPQASQHQAYSPLHTQFLNFPLHDDYFVPLRRISIPYQGRHYLHTIRFILSFPCASPNLSSFRVLNSSSPPPKISRRILLSRSIPSPACRTLKKSFHYATSTSSCLGSSFRTQGNLSQCRPKFKGGAMVNSDLEAHKPGQASSQQCTSTPKVFN
jgi:hypothetical protein